MAGAHGGSGIVSETDSRASGAPEPGKGDGDETGKLGLPAGSKPENRLPRPFSGLMRDRSGMMGFRLAIQPPEASALATPAAPTSSANTSEIVRPRLSMSCARTIIVAGSRTVAASNTSCCASASCRRWKTVGVSSRTAVAPAPSTARLARSRERGAWPSSRAWLSLRAVAGNWRSELESMGPDGWGVRPLSATPAESKAR